MNYYERHIGDYLKATAHLSLLEHGIYSRLLDVYYARETSIPEDQVARLVGARTDDEREALAIVLKEFFVLDAGKWMQARCDREIERYADKQTKAKNSADSRWNAVRNKSEGNANALPTHSEGNAPQSPVTSNQTPVTIEDKKPAAQAFVLPDWIPKDTWSAYCKVRSGKKAKNEPHALGLIVKDLEQFKLAGHNPVEVLNNSIKSGWSGVFEPKNKPFNQAAGVVITVPSRAGIDPELLRRDEASKQARAPSAEVLARLAKIKSDTRPGVAA